MQTTFGHVVFGVKAENLQFYRDLMEFLGWQTIVSFEQGFGVGDKAGVSLWFGTEVKDVVNDYDGPGINHFAISAESQADVDATVAYLQERGIPPLFDTPRHRPDFGYTEETTYYQVMFETPDRILVEVVYVGPRS
jgi:catechol 2,3-dioxygenase-like lactoylglutathione lyase family enzyme